MERDLITRYVQRVADEGDEVWGLLHVHALWEGESVSYGPRQDLARNEKERGEAGQIYHVLDHDALQESYGPRKDLSRNETGQINHVLDHALREGHGPRQHLVRN